MLYLCHLGVPASAYVLLFIGDFDKGLAIRRSLQDQLLLPLMKGFYNCMVIFWSRGGALHRGFAPTSTLL